MECAFDVIFIGGGPASLAGALHLRRMALAHPTLSDLSVAVIEKAPQLGDHSLSGAALDPRALVELFPEHAGKQLPFATKVCSEKLWYLTQKRGIPSPIMPPPLSNRGKAIISLSDFVRWLGGECEAAGVQIFTGEAVDELLFDERGFLHGVRIKGKGVDREGREKANYLPPTDIGCKIAVLGEGCRGHLTRRLIEEKGLDHGKLPQGHAVGIKELWEIQPENFHAGRVINTMGYPLDRRTFGGGFIYHLRDRHVALGLVVSLDYRDPGLHPFACFQRWKAHPRIAKILDGGRLLSYGARTIAEGGWRCVPKCFGDGFLLIGESAGLLNPMKLKGIDIGMKSGMLAAETALQALTKGDCSAEQLASYEARIQKSWIARELRRARNFHQGFHHGMLRGMLSAGIGMFTRGWSPFRPEIEADEKTMRKLSEMRETSAPPFEPDGKLCFDKLTCVYASGTKHEEDQPSHILIDDLSICNGRCAEEYGNPCQFFCPAQVFEMVEEEGQRKLQLNPSNCVHCKTCDIKDPYGIVTWVPPEGGGGPNYRGM